MSSANNAEQAQVDKSRHMTTLLFVDDEANILSALKRLFRPLDTRLFRHRTVASGWWYWNGNRWSKKRINALFPKIHRYFIGTGQP